MNPSRLLTSRRAFLGTTAAGIAAAGLGSRTEAQRLQAKARIVIIGAGAAGTALASRLVERLEGAEITLIDGRKEHFYQPGLSLVAAGLKPASYTVSSTTEWLPRGVTLVDHHLASAQYMEFDQAGRRARRRDRSGGQDGCNRGRPDAGL